MAEPGRIRTTDVAAVKLSPATLATVRADLADVGTLAPVLAPVQLDEQVPHGWLWAVDNEGRVVQRQRWRDPELTGGGS